MSATLEATADRIADDFIASRDAAEKVLQAWVEHPDQRAIDDRGHAVIDMLGWDSKKIDLQLGRVEAGMRLGSQSLSESATTALREQAAELKKINDAEIERIRESIRRLEENVALKNQAVSALLQRADAGDVNRIRAREYAPLHVVQRYHREYRQASESLCTSDLKVEIGHREAALALGERDEKGIIQYCKTLPAGHCAAAIRHEVEVPNGPDYPPGIRSEYTVSPRWPGYIAECKEVLPKLKAELAHAESEKQAALKELESMLDFYLVV